MTPVTARTTDTAAIVTHVLTKTAQSQDVYKRKIRRLVWYILLNALENVAKDPKNVSKHNEARSVIRHTSLDACYSRNNRMALCSC